MRPGEVPGLEEHAQTIWTPREMLELRLALYDLLEEARGDAIGACCSSSHPTTSAPSPTIHLHARYLAQAQEGPCQRGHNLVHLRAELHSGLRTTPARGGYRRVRAQVVAGHTEFAAEQVKDGEVRYSMERSCLTTSSSPSRLTSRR